VVNAGPGPARWVGSQPAGAFETLGADQGQQASRLPIDCWDQGTAAISWGWGSLLLGAFHTAHPGLRRRRPRRAPAAAAAVLRRAR
jgi:hypothetical protein